MSALDRTTRRKIFYAMAALFAIVAPLTLLYSQGYVFDFRRGGFVATGGVFVKTVQSGAKVFVDSEFSKETSFIARGALVTNLLPRRYTVRVEKDGYQPWIKTVRVSNEEVLEFRNVLLPRADISARILFRGRAGTPSRALPLAGRSELVLERGASGKPLTLTILDPKSGAILDQLERVTKWAWDERSGMFIVGRFAEGRMRWYRGVLLPGGGVRETPLEFRGLPAGFSADRVQLHPTEPDWFYFSAGGALFLQGRAAVPVAIAEQIHAFALSREHLYFITRNGFFAESDLTGGDTKLLGRKGLLLDEAAPAEMAVGPGGDVALRDAASGLFVYRPGRSPELEFVAGGVKGFDFSSSGDHMLLWDDRRLGVYWLKDNPLQPFELAGTKKYFFTADEPILRAYLNAAGMHAFYMTGRAIRMVELDDRANVNSYDLVRADAGSFALDRESLTLYWLQGALLSAASVR